MHPKSGNFKIKIKLKTNFKIKFQAGLSFKAERLADAGNEERLLQKEATHLLFQVLKVPTSVTAKEFFVLC